MEKQPVELSESQLLSKLMETGAQLQAPPRDASQLLELLGSIEDLFSAVDQNPSPQVHDALQPAARGLTTDNLLGHPDLEVQVSVLRCIHDLFRIEAPNAPYGDKIMKEIFDHTLSVLGKLPLLCGRFYAKALYILESIAKLQTCLVLLDLGCVDLTIQMLQVLLDAIRPSHTEAVISNMEEIMTLLIEESDEMSLDLLKPLLKSVKKENQNVSPLAGSLGERVLKRSGAKVMPYLMKVIEQMKKDVEAYTGVVASIRPDMPVEENVMEEASVPASNLVPIQQGDNINQESIASQPSTVDHDEERQQPPPTIAEVSAEPQILASVEAIPKKRGRPPKRKFEELDQHSGTRDSTTPSQVSHKRKRWLPKKLLPENHPSHSKILVPDQTVAGSGANESVSRGYGKPEDGKEYHESLISSRVMVWWPDDQRYYEGIVESYDPLKNEHKVVYFDGDVEFLVMEKEQWLLQYISAQGGQETNLPSSSTTVASNNQVQDGLDAHGIPEERGIS